ncbi:MAG: hypothetical protein JWN07_3229 [Hyphomicrobiales bacterium]|nr:hypothetical protein [Hyphomicrobiales bacterium]
MKAFDAHFDSARRHFGVALIDLNYAAADLARSVVCPTSATGAHAAFELLSSEIERLKHLSALIDQVAESAPGSSSDLSMLQRWWPELVRTPESQPTTD